MRRIAAVLLCLVFLPLLPPARAGEEGPEELLQAARARHLDHVAQGLESFNLRMILRRSQDAGLSNYKESAHFGYAWSAPETETFDFENTLEALHKPLRDVLRGIWRDLTGVLWFDTIGKAEGLKMRKDPNFTLVGGNLEEWGGIVATFENGPLALFEVEFVKHQYKLSFAYEMRKGLLQVVGRETTHNEKRVARLDYRVFREVNGYLLPTVLAVETDKNTVEYALQYESINGEPARVVELDPARVKELVSVFEKGWRKLSEEQKVESIHEIAETSHDLASAAIAKQGLRDRSPRVRAAAAEALGVMGRKNVVPALLSALKKDDKELNVALPIIQSLGEIGDPRAVDALGKGWWSQRTGEQAITVARAKIRALGNIRHPASVDTLINALYATKDETIGRIGADLLTAMKKLTGQDLGNSRQAWKDWWKKNRASYRF